MTRLPGTMMSMKSSWRECRRGIGKTFWSSRRWHESSGPGPWAGVTSISTSTNLQLWNDTENAWRRRERRSERANARSERNSGSRSRSPNWSLSRARKRGPSRTLCLATHRRAATWATLRITQTTLAWGTSLHRQHLARDRVPLRRKDNPAGPELNAREAPSSIRKGLRPTLARRLTQRPGSAQPEGLLRKTPGQVLGEAMIPSSSRQRVRELRPSLDGLPRARTIWPIRPGEELAALSRGAAVGPDARALTRVQAKRTVTRMTMMTPRWDRRQVPATTPETGRRFGKPQEGEPLRLSLRRIRSPNPNRNPPRRVHPRTTHR